MSSIPSESGLVAYWDFEEGNGPVIDKSINNNHGTLKEYLPSSSFTTGSYLPTYTNIVKSQGQCPILNNCDILVQIQSIFFYFLKNIYLLK